MHQGLGGVPPWLKIVQGKTLNWVENLNHNNITLVLSTQGGPAP